MIVARPKAPAVLLDVVMGRKTVLVAGCQVCMAVCRAGGEKEVGILAALLEIGAKRRGVSLAVLRATVPRQCDPGFLAPLDRLMERAEVCISLACGVGVQYMAERYPAKRVIPGVDTVFAGGSPVAGVWEERCRMCGDCLLAETGGICPHARCAKGLLNGPCGGSAGGCCEIDADMPCAWHLIYERLTAQGRLAELEIIQPPKNWSAAGMGMQSVVREELLP
jgi:hypothetical protein